MKKTVILLGLVLMSCYPRKWEDFESTPTMKEIPGFSGKQVKNIYMDDRDIIILFTDRTELRFHPSKDMDIDTVKTIK